MLRMTVTPGEPLMNEIDPAARAAAMPERNTINGAFLARAPERRGGGADWERLLPQPLLAPPRGGRYVAFLDYPQRDYGRILNAAATKLFPRLPMSEAHRLYARGDFDTFAGTTAGRVVLSMISDPTTILLRLGDIF